MIEDYCIDHHLDTVVVVSGVGCIKHLHMRLAKAIDTLEDDLSYEILALNGTISKGQAHLHIAVGDEKGKAYGGHLLYGTIVDTTCELVLLALDEYTSERIFDKDTGYDEIVFKEKK